MRLRAGARRRKTASAVRAEAARLAAQEAEQRDRDGDPEGAGVLRDLARTIRAIRILHPAVPPSSPWLDEAAS